MMAPLHLPLFFRKAVLVIGPTPTLGIFSVILVWKRRDEWTHKAARLW